MLVLVVDKSVVKNLLYFFQYQISMNQNTVDQLAERIINETNSAVSCLTLYLGHKLDLFNSLRKEGPITSEELSKKTKYSERYMREWLECMTANGYIDYDPLTMRFSISEEHARVLCDRDSISYIIPFVYWAPTLSLVVDKLLDAFRTGAGIPYSAYGKEVLFAQGEGNRPMFVNDIARWISSMPDIESRLRSQGGYVLDVGCGDGWANISLAKSFPLIKIDAIDIDLASINNATDNIKEAGLSDRISVYASPIEKASLKEKYDLVMTFESVHDMAYPIDALRKMKDVVAENGAVLVGDVKIKDKLEERNDLAGRLYYNFSVLICLPQSMEHPNSKATGAAMTPSTFEKYAKEAGFSKIEILPIEHLIWQFYRLTK
jgi:2-polyprenyl-3-methyl-5-hydroxy-6-metoxy-1,4-benzoquinol methylase